MIQVKGKHTNATIFTDDVEKSCLLQIQTFCNHPVFDKLNIAMMPDTHAGKGVPIGTVVALSDKIIPSVIGVDIACGMLSFCLEVGDEKFKDFDWIKFDKLLRRKLPTGMHIHSQGINFKQEFPWYEAQKQFDAFRDEYIKRYDKEMPYVEYNYEWFLNLCTKIGSNSQNVTRSIGTLGGGNHFLEIGRSKETGKYWLTIHSGSRNFGLKVATYHQKKAEDVLKEKRVQLEKNIKETILNDSTNLHKRKELLHDVKVNANLDFDLNIKGLEWLEDEDAVEYMTDMIFTQMYAGFNRQTIEYIALDCLQESLDIQFIYNESIECIHNYIDPHDWFIRKGAIRAYQGEKSVIPFNMRDGLLICTGKNNSDWNYSAPHGAGRVLSRSVAKQTIKLEDFQETMEGIHTTSVTASTLDESPFVYKDSELIEILIEDTCNVLEHVIPIYNMKNASEIYMKQKKERDDEEKKNYSNTMGWEIK